MTRALIRWCLHSISVTGDDMLRNRPLKRPQCPACPSLVPHRSLKSQYGGYLLDVRRQGWKCSVPNIVQSPAEQFQWITHLRHLSLECRDDVDILFHTIKVVYNGLDLLSGFNGDGVFVMSNSWTTQTRTLLLTIVYEIMLVSLRSLMKVRWKMGWTLC